MRFLTPAKSALIRFAIGLAFGPGFGVIARWGPDGLRLKEFTTDSWGSCARGTRATSLGSLEMGIGSPGVLDIRCGNRFTSD